MREQRKFMRVELALQVECFAVDAQGVSGPAVKATLVDLSAGGARVGLDGPVPLGAAIRLNVSSEQPPLSVTLLATVVRCHRRESGGFDVGVQWVALTPDQRVSLTRFVLSHAKRTGTGSSVVAAA